MGIAVSRLPANHPAEFGNGSAVVSGPTQSQCQRIPVVDLLGTQFNRQAILFNGVNQIPCGLEGVGDGEVEVRVSGAQADSGTELGQAARICLPV